MLAAPSWRLTDCKNGLANWAGSCVNGPAAIMESRERVFRALKHQLPDRVPRDFWATAEPTSSSAAGCISPTPVPCSTISTWTCATSRERAVHRPEAAGPSGRLRKRHLGRATHSADHGHGETAQSYKSVTHFPLAGVTNVRELDAYAFWPSPDWFDYSPVREQAQAVRDRGRVVAFMGDRLNRFAQLKPAMYLRGIDQALVDMLIEPEIFQAIADRLTRFYNE